MKLDDEREALIAELASDPERQNQLRRILLAQDAAVEREREIERRLFWLTHLPQHERDVLVAIEEARGAVGIGTVEEIEAALFDKLPDTVTPLQLINYVRAVGRPNISPGTSALVSAALAGWHRGTDAGQRAGHTLVSEAYRFAANFSRARAPWLADDDINSFAALVDELRARGLESADMDDTEHESFPPPEPDDAKLELLAMQTIPDTPEGDAAVVRYLLSLPEPERQAVYTRVNRFYELLIERFKVFFPDGDPGKYWNPAPRNDDTMRAYLAQLEASAQ